MAYNFKSIADVDIVETPSETANVLIEEDGIIKKAPKTAVGGTSGNSVADLVIRFNNFINDATIDNISIASGSVEAIYDAFENGKYPVVEVEVLVTPNESSYAYTARRFPAHIVIYGDWLYVGFICSDTFFNGGYSCRIVIDASNNYALDSFDKYEINATPV